MVGMAPSSRFPLKKFQEILSEIKKKGNLVGVLLSTRDGNAISMDVDENFNASGFSAMTASVIESAEDLMDIIHEKKVNKIIAELDDQSIIIIGCNKIAFLVLIVGENSKVEQLFKEIDMYIEKITKFL